jgi:aldehyde:ferredoxin oxidoreductase
MSTETYGYFNNYFFVDLTTKKITKKSFDESILKDFIGGSGLGAYILYNLTDANTEPFGEDNLLAFLTGPFVGTAVPSSGRHAVVTKSPATNIWAESDIGGSFGVMLRKCGIDGIIIKGKSETPVYLWITDDKVEIKSAVHLWGKDTFYVDQKLKLETGENCEVTSIGIAGENLVKFASIMSDGKDSRAAGRAGVGAVMGSKKLKAICAKGTKEVPIYDEASLSKSVRTFLPTLIKNTKNRKEFGTAGSIVASEKVGDLPIQNWKVGEWESGANKISGQVMTETILTGRYYCKNCIIGCGRKIKVQSEEYTIEGSGPEYETLGMLGSMCLIDNLEAICKGNELCNKYGLDTISTGAVIAFAMECYEGKIITSIDTNGVELEWGNSEAMIEMIKMIANRRGIGNILAEGVMKASEIIGLSTKMFAIHVKGLEPPAHDPRAFNSLALAYATSNRGACHLQAFSHAYETGSILPEAGYNTPFNRFLTDGKGEMVAVLQNYMSLLDSLKICKFAVTGGVSVTQIVDWLNYITGWNYTIEEFFKTGERIFNLKRIFNNSCGITNEDDRIPNRLLNYRKGGGTNDHLPLLPVMLNEYYDYRKWDNNGRPSVEKIKDLKLNKYLERKKLY